MQRLFSNSADGWPGVGLLLLRLLICGVMIKFALDSIHEGPPPASLVLPIMCIACGLFLLVGFFTPVAAAVAVLVKAWLAIKGLTSHSGDSWIPLAQAIFAAALGMIGPGAWSIDARRFGRKHMDLSDR